MFYKTLLVVSLIMSSSYSLELDDLAKNALNENYDLKQLNKSIKIATENVKLSKMWQNPILSIGANDIQLDQPFVRNQEAMQANFIAISQIIPINDSLKYQTNIALNDQKIAQMNLENKRLKINALIYEYGYDIVIMNKKLAFINKYMNNVKELELVAIGLYESGKVKQIVPLNAKLLHSKLEISKENLQFELKSTYHKLEQITYRKITSVEHSLKYNKIDFSKIHLDVHPVLQAIKLEEAKYQEEAKLARAKKFSDIKVNLGYFSRDQRFNDYVNLSFSVPLPIYGRENTNIAKAKYKVSQIQDKLEAIKSVFESRFMILQEAMKKSYHNYENLQNSMVPQREFIQKNLEAHYGLGHVKSVDLLANINETITLEMMALDELRKYYDADAKIKYFIGNRP